MIETKQTNNTQNRPQCRSYATVFFEAMDGEKIHDDAQHQTDAATHAARIKVTCRQQRLQQDEFQAEAEGFPYIPCWCMLII